MMGIEREIQRIADTDALIKMIKDLGPDDKILVIVGNSVKEVMSYGYVGDIPDMEKVYMVEAFKNIVFNGGCSCPPESPE